jgi:hypothetical protein
VEDDSQGKDVTFGVKILSVLIILRCAVRHGYSWSVLILKLFAGKFDIFMKRFPEIYNLQLLNNLSSFGIDFGGCLDH